MELESSCLLCKKSVAKKRPLHSVNNLHLISTLVGLLDDIVDNSVDNTVLPKNSRVCPSCFPNKLRQDLYDLENQLKEQLKQAVVEGTNLTSTLTSSSVVAAWISSAEKRGIIIALAENCGFCSNALRFIGSHNYDGCNY